MQDFIAALVGFFLIDPIQAEMAEALAAARAPQAVIADVAACARSAAPRVVERAAEEPWWAVSSVVQVWVGASRPEALLLDVAPGCAGAVAAAQPFLRGDAA